MSSESEAGRDERRPWVDGDKLFRVSFVSDDHGRIQVYTARAAPNCRDVVLRDEQGFDWELRSVDLTLTRLTARAAVNAYAQRLAEKMRDAEQALAEVRERMVHVEALRAAVTKGE